MGRPYSTRARTKKSLRNYDRNNCRKEKVCRIQVQMGA